MRVLVSFFIVLFICGCNNNETRKNKEDLTSKAAVLVHLQKSNSNLKEDDVCIEDITSFEDLIIVGYFANDVGCEANTAFYRGEEVSFSEMSKLVLMNNNWSDKNSRSKLALNYTKEVIKIWKTVLSDEPNNFKQLGLYNFTPPEAILKDEEVTVNCWMKEPAGMLSETNYYHFSITFGEDGGILRSKKSNRFTTD